MTNYNDGKWHGWNGGECPVHPETVVKFFTHQQRTGVGSAKYLTWSMTNNIVAFRVIKEYKEPREWWCVAGRMLDSEEAAQRFLDELNQDYPQIDFGKVYKVREVLE